MNEAKLKRIEALAAEATEGPWSLEYRPMDLGNPESGYRRLVAIMAGGGNVPVMKTHDGVGPGSTVPLGIQNAEFIVAAREALPELIAEVRRWREVASTLASTVFMGEPQINTDEAGGPGVCICETPPRPSEHFDPARQHVERCTRFREAFAEIQRLKGSRA